MQFLKKIFSSKQVFSNTPDQESMEEETIHMVIPPSSTQTDLDTKIQAIAWKKRTKEGVTKYGTTNYSGSNILSMLEAASARYWQQIIDEAEITHDQAVAWVQHLEQVTGDTYFFRVTNNVKISSTAFICGIAKASRNFSVTHTAFKQYPDKIQLILKPFIVDMPNNFYSKCHREAQSMEQAILDGRLDNTFIHYLSRATGAKILINPNNKNAEQVAVADPYHALLVTFYDHYNHQSLRQRSPSW